MIETRSRSNKVVTVTRRLFLVENFAGAAVVGLEEIFAKVVIFSTYLTLAIH